MPFPRYNPQIVGQGLAWLTGAFQNQPNVRAWLAACLGEVQALEDMYWGMNPGVGGLGVLVSRFLATAPLYTLPETNAFLDVVGELVGQPRTGLADAQYLTTLYLRIATNHSEGKTTDWSNFASILLRAGATGPVQYYDASTASQGASFYWFVGAQQGVPAPSLVANILDAAVPNGVRGVFGYSTWPDGNDFEWADYNAQATSGQGTYGDAVGGLVGGLLVTCEEL